MRYTVVFVLNIFKQTRDKHFILYNMFHVKLNYYEIIQLQCIFEMIHKKNIYAVHFIFLQL